MPKIVIRQRTIRLQASSLCYRSAGHLQPSGDLQWLLIKGGNSFTHKRVGAGRIFSSEKGNVAVRLRIVITSSDYTEWDTQGTKEYSARGRESRFIEVVLVDQY